MCLSGSVDAFLEAGAPDDLVPVAETGTCPCLAVLVPERGDSIVELAKLGGEDDVVSLGQTVQELGTLLAGALDLGTDVLQNAHVYENECPRVAIPLPVAEIVDPVLIEAEEMRNFVENRDADLTLQVGRIGKRLLEWAAVDDDSVG